MRFRGKAHLILSRSQDRRANISRLIAFIYTYSHVRSFKQLLTLTRWHTIVLDCTINRNPLSKLKSKLVSSYDAVGALLQKVDLSEKRYWSLTLSICLHLNERKIGIDSRFYARVSRTKTEMNASFYTASTPQNARWKMFTVKFCRTFSLFFFFHPVNSVSHFSF